MIILKPAISLMNKLSYSRKMFVAAFFFCVPIALLAYFLVSNIQEQIEFSRKERAGVQYAAAIDKLLESILDGRNSALSGAEGQRKHQGFEQEMSGMDLVESSIGNYLSTKTSYQALKAKIGKLNDFRGLTARQVFEAQNSISSELLGMIIIVSDNSNLTLDPDIDSYYLMDTFTTKLPSLADAITRASLIAFRIASNQPVADRSELLILSVQIKSLVESVNKNIRVACGKNPVLTARLQKNLDAVDSNSGAFLKHIEALASGGGKSTSPASYAKAAEDARGAVFRMNDVVAKELDGLLVERISRFRTKMTTYLSISFLAFLLGIYLNMGCYLSVRRGIISVKEVSSKVADGDLTAEAPLLSQDELGDMAQAFNAMTGSLRNIVVTLANVTGSVHSCAGKLSDSVDQQSGFSAQLSSSVVEISSTMEEFTSTASQIAQHSQGVVDRADRTLEESKTGAAEVENLSFKINDLSENIQANLSEIVELGRKSKEINKVMEIINNIANQTKLIAFNAALEAASAGEAGKRFGVVAVEIRRLADSVVESTKEIEGKITEILDSVNRLVMSSEKSFALIQEGQEYAAHTVGMLIESVDGVEETANAARQISLSTQQQQIASGQVVLALKDIERGIRHATDSMCQTNGVTDELMELSVQLGKLVRTFNVGEERYSQSAATTSENC